MALSPARKAASPCIGISSQLELKPVWYWTGSKRVVQLAAFRTERAMAPAPFAALFPTNLAAPSTSILAAKACAAGSSCPASASAMRRGQSATRAMRVPLAHPSQSRQKCGRSKRLVQNGRELPQRLRQVGVTRNHEHLYAARMEPIDQPVSHLALQIDVDDRELWIVLGHQALGLLGGGDWAGDDHARLFQEEREGVGDLPTIFHQKHARAPQDPVRCVPRDLALAHANCPRHPCAQSALRSVGQLGSPCSIFSRRGGLSARAQAWLFVAGPRRWRPRVSPAGGIADPRPRTI